MGFVNRSTRKNANRPVILLGLMEDFRLHPLIHTRLELNLVQDVENIKSGAEAPQWYLTNES